jgi:hypothetical protein
MNDSRLKSLFLALVAPLLLCLPLIGCSKAPPERSPEEVEKARQEHIERAQRELGDG